MRTHLAVLSTTALLLAGCSGEPAASPEVTDLPSPTATTQTSSPPTASPTPTSPSPPVASPSPAALAEPEPQPEPEPEPAPEPNTPVEVTVTIADFDYAPDPVQVAAGGTVTWTNQDSTAHTATVSGGGPNTGAISGGASASLTFDTPGTYDYVCQFHPGSMTGTVMVR